MMVNYGSNAYAKRYNNTSNSKNSSDVSKSL